MTHDETFPRLLSAVTAAHWTATFGVLAVSAQQWRADAAGAAVSRLVSPLLAGNLAHPAAAFALSVVFAVLAMAFLWLFATAVLETTHGSGEYRDVSQLAYAAGIAGVSLTGGLAAIAGSLEALMMASALIAALFASALAIGAGPAALLNRKGRAAATIARLMAAKAAENAQNSRFSPVSAELRTGKDR
ncbi:MAG: hypothetical protein IPL47_06485 [Phyllobacteriaceae bacterium]|nr:hypothetical protein [Phyllobacteriaceae bacterium]